VFEGGQVDLGRYLSVLRRGRRRRGHCGHRALPPAGLRHLRPEGREHGLPRYHPPWLRTRSRPRPPHWGRAAGSSRPLRAFFRRLRGDPSRRALPPGSHRPRVAPGRSRATRPHPRLSLGPVYGAARAPPYR
jgi:hypothetical protein